MVQMLLAEGMLLCSLFWAFCWLGTGSDEKNIRNFSTYPDEVQKIVKAPHVYKLIQQPLCNTLLPEVHL